MKKIVLVSLAFLFVLVGCGQKKETGPATKTDNGIASIVSSKNRYAKALGVDIEDLSVNEVLNLIMETPRILKSPILVDEKRLQVGYKEDDIRAFLPRSVRNVENAEARLRAAL